MSTGPGRPPGGWISIAELRLKSREIVDDIEHWIEAHPNAPERQLKRLDKAVILIKVGNKMLKKAAKETILLESRERVGNLEVVQRIYR